MNWAFIAEVLLATLCLGGMIGFAAGVVFMQWAFRRVTRPIEN
jgi:hypothetical protein